MGINLLRPYEEANFLPFQGDDLTLRNPERGYEFLRDFMGYMGPLAYKKYNELVDNDAILLSSLYNTGGVCWDFPVLNKQIIVIDENSGIYNLMAAAASPRAAGFCYWPAAWRKRSSFSALLP